MSQTSAIDEFVSTILRNLEKNGYPTKAVAFPLEKMYESASQKGFSFNKVRDILKERGIATELTENRVIFSPCVEPDTDFDRHGIAAAAQQILQNMSADEQAKLAEMMQNMGPDDLKKIQEQWQAMPSTEKQRLMEQMEKSSFRS